MKYSENVQRLSREGVHFNKWKWKLTLKSINMK
uniref:Uncharacterized protein n=1 Tax=CrAss-like virus sp. ctYsL76 TaxID=2826826 RepID=A0A8S5QL98_9CAUD|nr:MAG TPA: hypothetical protein [CrAss-like virus sp. ctYsL76]